ncbi:hypothetical protein DM02DRAFT_651540 [Periconia macrospinosa]|uniref:Uncharacterized protein n=1 Tax=Periconia macrospinosa TaxID=97972 RepID=A0A2V1E4K0_9PLEO|nr:hypothetical protein DM02DRAFT_651540 [Periconia macrospinosa]
MKLSVALSLAFAALAFSAPHDINEENDALEARQIRVPNIPNPSQLIPGRQPANQPAQQPQQQAGSNVPPRDLSAPFRSGRRDLPRRRLRRDVDDINEGDDALEARQIPGLPKQISGLPKQIPNPAKIIPGL